MKLSLLAAALLVLLLPAGARAQDTVVKVTRESVKGKISAISKTEVAIGGNTVTVAEIDVIRFEGEPVNLNAIRNQINNGGYENALRALDKIDPAKIERAEVKQDLQYYQALANARLALGGGTVSVADAGKQMLAFVREYPDNYHALTANLILGDLLVAAGRFDNAKEYYKVAQDAPFPEYKIRAGVALGRALAGQQKFDEALTQFESVLPLTGQAAGAGADTQLQAAVLGKATCLAATGKPDEGIQLVEQVIAKLPPEAPDLYAQAYVTLGNCYVKKPNSAKAALLAFLHIDLLYSANTQAHAEALYNLTRLWNELGRADRATESLVLLKERYPNSSWASK